MRTLILSLLLSTACCAPTSAQVAYPVNDSTVAVPRMLVAHLLQRNAVAAHALRALAAADSAMAADALLIAALRREVSLLQRLRATEVEMRRSLLGEIAARERFEAALRQSLRRRERERWRWAGRGVIAGVIVGGVAALLVSR